MSFYLKRGVATYHSFFLAFFELLYLESDIFIRSLTNGSQSTPTWNLGSLLGLQLGPSIYSQVPLLLLDYRWSRNPPTYRMTVTSNWYWTHTVLKFDLQSRWITGPCHYTWNSTGSFAGSAPAIHSFMYGDFLTEQL